MAIIRNKTLKSLWKKKKNFYVNCISANEIKFPGDCFLDRQPSHLDTISWDSWTTSVMFFHPSPSSIVVNYQCFYAIKCQSSIAWTANVSVLETTYVPVSFAANVSVPLTINCCFNAINCQCFYVISYQCFWAWTATVSTPLPAIDYQRFYAIGSKCFSAITANVSKH